MASTSTSNPTEITPEASNNEIVIRPSKGWMSVNLAELWQYRQLLFYFVWRDIKVRYKQTVFGPAWAVVSPIANMVLFTLLFGNLAQLDSEGVPYSVFTFSALLPWTFFSGALSSITGSLVGNANLIKKVYFPRLILPITSVVGRVPDFFLSFLVMLALMFYFGIVPNLFRLMLLPLLIIYAGIASLGIGLWLASINVRYRDIKFITSYLIRFLMYAAPVVYSIDEITSRLDSGSFLDTALLTLYYTNPMVSVIEGFRWALLDRGGGFEPQMIISVFVTLTLFVTGVMYFRRTEKYFADYV